MRRPHIQPVIVDRCIDCKSSELRTKSSYLCKVCYNKRLKVSLATELKRMGERKHEQKQHIKPNGRRVDKKKS